MSPLDSPSRWTHIFREFQCPRCRCSKAYRSRRRNIMEKLLLPVLMLKPVRCERCYHRTYTLSSVLVLDRKKFIGKRAPGHAEVTPASTRRIA